MQTSLASRLRCFSFVHSAISPVAWDVRASIQDSALPGHIASDVRQISPETNRAAKASSNDADRLKKYLARFGLSWDQITGAALRD